MYFLSRVAHSGDAPALDEDEVAELEVLEPETGLVEVGAVVVGALAVAGVDAEVVAAAATLLLTTTAAEVALDDDELVLPELDTVLAESTLELILVLRVEGVAEELAFGVLRMLLGAEAAALELAFWLGLGVKIEEKLA